MLLTGGQVVTSDASGIPRTVAADVRLRGHRIAEIGPDLAPEGERVVDARNHLVVPGFVDTHRHTWQTAFRGVAADWTLAQYVAGMHGRLRDAYTPEDLYLGNLVGRLEALSSGITTLLDWSHGITSSEHGDAALDGLLDAPGRSVFAYAGPVGPGHDEPVEKELRRLHDRLGRADQRVSMALGLRGPQYTSMATTRTDVETARGLGLRVSVHGGSAHFGQNRPVAAMAEAGLLDERTTVIHCNTLHDEELDMMAEAGASASISPIVELQMGFGWPATGRLLDRGIRPSLSVDNCAAIAGDMFRTMHTTLYVQRGLDNDSRDDASSGSHLRLSCADVFEFATACGARAVGMPELGTIAVGREADLVLLRTDELSVYPPTNAINSVVTSAHPGLAETVIVAGEVVKEGGRLNGVDLPELRRRLAQSQRAVAVRAGLPGSPIAVDGSWSPI